MFLPYSYIFVIMCFQIFFVRILFLIFIKHRSLAATISRKKPAKTMIILGSGGHTAEMLRIVKYMNCNNYMPRIYVCASTDNISIEKVKSQEGIRNDYKIIKVIRSREVGQSYISSVWTTILASLESLSVLWVEKPELILCNGPGTCVPLCIIAFLFKILFISNVTTIFIESFCRVDTFSLTGKIVYYLVDHVIVQWPYLSKSLYDKVYSS